jgi:fibronectin-binding autotransporter adhesin
MATIHWGGKSGDWSTKADWTGGVVPGAGDDAYIDASGAYTVTIDSAEAAHSLTVNDAKATVTDSSSLTIGTTLTVAAGTFELNSGGTINGGTLSATGGAFQFNNGTLSDVTYEGTLVDSYYLTITDGLVVTGAGGTGPGTIDVTQNFFVTGGETLDNATLDIGATNGGSTFDVSNAGGNPTLTLGSHFSIVEVGTNTSVTIGGEDSNDTLVNDGTITAGTTGGLEINPSSFTNNGSIAISNGDNVDIGSSTFTNNGSITVGSGSALSLSFNLTTAQLAGITNSGTLTLNGTLNNAGATLFVGTGSGLGTVALRGTISGGTIVDGGSGFPADNGTLSDVTYEGTLVDSYYLTITDGLVVTGAGGTGPGTIDVTQNFFVTGGETLDNATLDIGATNGGSTFDVSNAGGNPTLTLGSHFSIVEVGTNTSVTIGGEDSNDTLVNDGTITAGTTGVLEINPSSFTNNGSIAISNGDNVDIGSSTFTNNGSITVSGSGTANLQPTAKFTNLPGSTLTGGSYEVDANSTINLSSNTKIVTDDATIILSGSGSTIQSLNTSKNVEVAIDATLTTIGATGTLELLAGRNWTTTLAMSNAGTLELGGGTFTAPSLANSGTTSGYGVLAIAVTNSGTIAASGGQTLSLVGGSLTNLSGTTLTGGTYTIGAGGTLQLANNVTITTLNAVIALKAGAAVQSLNTTTSKQVSLQSSLTTIGATGALELSGASSYTTTNAIANAGLLELGGNTFTSGALTDAPGSTLSGFGTVASVVTEAGTVTSSGGALAFTGTGDTFSTALAGTEIDFAGGTDLLQSGSSLTSAAVGVSGGAVVTFAASQSYAGDLTQASGTTLALGANSLTLTGSGSSVAGTINSTGTLAFAGGSQAIDAGVSLNVSNWTVTGTDAVAINLTLTFSGPFSTSSGTTLTIGGGDTLTLAGVTTLAGTIGGAGTVSLADGASLGGNLADSGALSMASGTTLALGADNLTLSGAGSTLAGSLTGTGALALTGGTVTLNTGASVGTASWSLSGGAVATLGESLAYSGDLTQGAGTTLALGNNTLTLTGSGSTLAGTVSGTGGTLALAGGTQTFGAGAALSVSSWSMSASDAASVNEALTYAGTFSEGAGTSLIIGKGDSLTLSGVSTFAAGVGGTGTLALTGAAAMSVTASLTVSGALTQAAGTTITIASGDTLTLSGTGSSLAGSVTGAGATLTIAGGTTTLDTTTFSVSTLSLTGGTTTLNESLTFTGALSEGAGATLTLTTGDKYTFGGAVTLSGTVDGASTLKVSNATVNGLTIGGTADLEDAGTVEQTGAITVGDRTSSAAVLTIAAGADYTIEAGGIALGKAKTSSIKNSGTLTDAAAGVTVIAVKTNDTGSVVVMDGTLDFSGALTGTGTMTVDSGANLEADRTAASTLTVTLDGGDTTLALKEAKKFAATISGFAQGETIDLLATKATAATINASDQLVIVNRTKVVATLQLTAANAGETFTVGSDGNGGSDITVATGGGAAPPMAPRAPLAGVAASHQFVAAMAGFGAGVGGAAIAVGVAHLDASRSMLGSPRLQLA